MKTKLLGLVAIVPLGLAISVGAANASPTTTTTFAWSESAYGGSGTLTATFVGGDEYSVTGISGTFDGYTISSLVSPFGYNGNDNELFYPSSVLLDGGGISFVAGGIDWQIFYYNSEFGYQTIYTFEGGQYQTPDEFSATPTPLPAALPLFATGIGAMGLLGWRRKRKNAGVIAAA